MTGKHSANTIEIGDEAYLLAGDQAVHLVRRAIDNDDSMAAMQSWRFEQSESWHSGYDIASLQDPRWKARTLCGREWYEMVLGDGPEWDQGDEPIYAPDCGLCLRIVSRSLTSQPPDDRIPLIAAMVMDETHRAGGARIINVPGDQTEALRSAVRAEMRRHRLRGRTFMIGEMVYVYSDDAWQAVPQDVKDAYTRTLMARISAVFQDPSEDPGPIEPRGINWDTWGR